MLAYVTGSVDEELLHRNEYLVTENRILRDQIKGRMRLTDAQRISLARAAKGLGRRALNEVAQIVRPETILAWHRRLVAGVAGLRGGRRLLRGLPHAASGQGRTGREKLGTLHATARRAAIDAVLQAGRSGARRRLCPVPACVA